MAGNFPETLAALRRLTGLSQREAAKDMLISQALLSHYENGAREPGLGFVCRACDYYGVTADYLLGRTDASGTAPDRKKELRDLVAKLLELAEKAHSVLEDTP